MSSEDYDPRLLDRIQKEWQEAYNAELHGPAASLAGYRAAGAVLDLLAAEGRLSVPLSEMVPAYRDKAEVEWRYTGRSDLYSPAGGRTGVVMSLRAVEDLNGPLTPA